MKFFTSPSRQMLMAIAATAVLILSVVMVFPASAKVTFNDALGNTTFSYGGYIKADAMWTRTKGDNDIPSSSIARDFYLPGATPVCTNSEGCSSTTVFDSHVRTTRFNFGTDTNIDGHQIKSFIELDFMVTPNGNEVVSNSYTPRIRHAYFTFDNLLVGQTWSTFMNVGALPESLDFLGPTEGTLLNRQTMVRYTLGNWQFSAENPESLVMNYQGDRDGARAAYDESIVPDLIARYNHKAGWGSVSVSAMLRQLSVDNDATDDSTWGWGVNTAGKIAVGELDDIRFSFTGGSGMGRYMAIAMISDAVFDEHNSLNTIDVYSGFIAYRHFWTEKLRSTFNVSALVANHDTDLTGEGVSEKSTSMRVNLLYSPVKSVTFGAELMRGTRTLENGFDGDLDRLQFSAKYAF